MPKNFPKPREALIKASMVEWPEAKEIDDIIGQLEVDLAEQREDCMAVTFWISAEHKTKYETIQRRSKRRFGRLIKEIIKRAIDRVEIKDE